MNAPIQKQCKQGETHANYAETTARRRGAGRCTTRFLPLQRSLGRAQKRKNHRTVSKARETTTPPPTPPPALKDHVVTHV